MAETKTVIGPDELEDMIRKLMASEHPHLELKYLQFVVNLGGMAVVLNGLPEIYFNVVLSPRQSSPPAQ